MERLACFVIAHNLGDAVIQSGLVKRLVAGGYAQRYLVWTRPQVAFLFSDIPGCEIVGSQFPIGTDKQFGFRNALRFIGAVRQLRRLKPSVSIDFIGDQRDRWFGRLTGSQRHEYIGWTPDHPFSKIIRNPFGTGRPTIVVPSTTPNIYAAYDLLIDALLQGKASAAPVALRRVEGERARRIGIHPFASQACKLWPDERWGQLADKLLADGAEISVFGAPSERPRLEKIFGGQLERIKVRTESLARFAAAVAELDLMIGLDSFSVHMAHRQGVPSIMINACNDPRVWTPPTCTGLSESGGCDSYPCLNIPSCEGKVGEYACVKAITVDAVLRTTLVQ